MISTKEDLKEYMKEDFKALYPNGASYITRLKDPILKYEILLRKCEYHRNRSLKNPYLKISYLFLKYRFRSLGIKLGFSIPENCFGPGLSIAHYGSIVINPNVVIGANCRIHTGVNIGANKTPTDVPVIGDNVYIGPGAKIFGSVTIGNNVKIGANAVVTNSFGNNVVVAGIPAKIING